MQTGALIDQLLDVMARLRAPGGCPWDREQDHKSIRMHAIEEIYELIDAIEAGDDAEMAEELGDLLLQVVFHCQMAKERGAFDFDRVTQLITEKLTRDGHYVYIGMDHFAKASDELALAQKNKSLQRDGASR